MKPCRTATRNIAARCALATLLATPLAIGPPAWAQGGGRPQVDLQCLSYGMGPMLECTVDIKRRDGTPLDGAQVTLGALMPSMPMAHTVKPMKATPTGKPGQYRATLELEMLGVWAVDIDISGPARDKLARNVTVGECKGQERCEAPPARAAASARPAR